MTNSVIDFRCNNFDMQRVLIPALNGTGYADQINVAFAITRIFAMLPKPTIEWETKIMRYFSAIWCLCVFALPPQQLFGQAISAYDAPAAAGMSAEKLDQGVALFRTAVEKDEIRNAVVLVSRRGQIVLHEAVGWRNKEKQLPMQRDTLFRMASNTKAVVATGVLMLVQDGCLSLDEPVGAYLPAFDNDKCRHMTVRHLLTHTSGLRIKTLFLEPLMQPSPGFPNAPNLQREVNRFAEIGPQKRPGTTFSYNNPGYNILGALIEVRSSQSLETFLTQRIYAPLGMSDTSNHPLEEKVERMSVVYERKKDKWRIRFAQTTKMRVPFIRASGGMISTAGDFAKFCQLYLNKGHYNGCCLLAPQFVEEATTAQTKSAYSAEELKKRESFYGLGWFVANDGHYSHGGSEGTYAWIDPGRELIGLIFTQSPGGKIPRNEFRKIVNSACHD